MSAGAAAILDRSPFVLEVEDTFDDDRLDERLWVAHYLPHWSSPARSMARYEVGAGLVLRIDLDQPAWSPEYTGELRVSSLQTGTFAGPPGSGVGQHRFRSDLVVREPQEVAALYTPTYGLFELNARFADDPTTMAAFWMIGYEDAPERSAEICIAEIFGRDVSADRTGIGMGLHPFHDPSLRDDFTLEWLPIDARQPHSYAAAWLPGRVAFYVDDRLVKVSHGSPAYPMQIMLDVFEFRTGNGRAPDPGDYPKRFLVDSVRAYRLTEPPDRLGLA